MCRLLQMAIHHWARGRANSSPGSKAWQSFGTQAQRSAACAWMYGLRLRAQGWSQQTAPMAFSVVAWVHHALHTILVVIRTGCTYQDLPSRVWNTSCIARPGPYCGLATTSHGCEPHRMTVTVTAARS